MKIALIGGGNWVAAAVYLSSSLALGLGAVFAGAALVRLLGG